jgi:AhpD family alkylhydroperoxidase
MMALSDKDRKHIKQIIADRQKAHAYYSENSKVYNAFVSMEKVTFKDGDLKKKNKEMIAIGISITQNCESCMEWHIREALRSGASNEEILDAIGVGIEMGGGPATVAARFAMKVLDYYAESLDT